MVQNFEVYGVEITVEKPIAVCVACSFCVNIDMAVDKNVTHFCEILGKEMTNQEADNKPCSECPITYRNKESLKEGERKNVDNKYCNFIYGTCIHGGYWS